jgi:3-keto-disaccharide hydrolase
VNLQGWKLRKPDGRPSWSVQNGMLVNSLAENEHGTDLVSEEKFGDFTARFEYLIPAGANSGFYLRGRHEIQILDDFKKNKAEVGGNGAIYSVKPVSLFASRAPGQWQEVEATIKGNRITAILNGVKVHDNVEVNRATGGELDANLSEPGPILLQGDHGPTAFRNIRIRTLK